MRPYLLLALLLIASPSLAQSQDTMRLVVVDRSGSMSGAHIDQVRDDLKKMIAADPPTKDRPLGFILFDSTAQPAAWFHDAAANRFVDSIKADGGGTSIASGLREALQQIRKHGHSADVELYLYTDDEDATPDKTKTATEELSKLFTQRNSHSLDQTVVVRSWSSSGAGATIGAVLGKNPDVDFRHGTSPLFVGTRVSPPQVAMHTLSMRLNSIGTPRWADSTCAEVVIPVRCDLVVAASRKRANPSSVEVRLSLPSPGVLEGTTPTTSVAAPGSSQVTTELRLPVTATEARLGKLFKTPRLECAVIANPDALPFRSNSAVAEVKPLPPLPQSQTSVSITVDGISPGRWYETPSIAVYAVGLSVDVQGITPAGSRLTLEAPNGVTRVRLSPETLQAGKQSVKLLLAASVLPAPSDSDLEFRVLPPKDTPRIRFNSIPPLAIKLAGPTKVKATAHAGAFSLTRLTPRERSSASIAIAVEGPVSRRFAKMARFEVCIDGAGAVAQAQGYQEIAVPLPAPRRAEPNYFIDDLTPCRLTISAPNAPGVVAPQTVQFDVRTVAPFKLHLAAGATTVALLGCLVVIRSFLKSLGTPAVE